jgi:pullulanase
VNEWGEAGMLSNKELEAYMDDFSLITIVVQPIVSSPSFGYSLVLPDGKLLPMSIVKQEIHNQRRIFKCTVSESLDVSKEYWIETNGCKYPLKIGSVVRTQEFDSLFYTDTPLGSLHQEDCTSFSVWSPVAAEIRLRYKKHGARAFDEKKMLRNEKGIWHLTLAGNHHLTEYVYLVKTNHEWHEAVDPYSRSVTVNGKKSVVVDMRETDPENWNRSQRRINLRSKTDSIIYEAHIRDFTSHADSGVNNKGKYLGFAEEGTRTKNGFSTGLDYLVSLGVSHVQLMPVGDFGSVDEENSEGQYNWGYDPVHFFAPEGSYATDPYDPVCRIKELKTLIHSLQKHNLSVIVDVVFNHVYKREYSAFEQLVPGYYFRYDEGGNPINGTGVGNDTASERKMMRRFIIDALTYWMQEYKVDGFRFDLMGIHDVETMKMAAEQLKAKNPGVFLLGEGWDLNTSLSAAERATLGAAKKLPDFSFFNDVFRDTVKGSIFPEGQKGFISGEHAVQGQLGYVFSGCVEKGGLFLTPDQSINYTECHDNHTLFDLLLIRHPEEDEVMRRRRQQLALALTLFSRGVPFIHAGQEFFRTKKGVENSYNCPDSINAMNWSDCEHSYKDVEYFRALISIRRKQPIFHHSNTRVTDRSNFSKGIFGIEIHLPPTDKKRREWIWERVLLFFNQHLEEKTLSLGDGSWGIEVEDHVYRGNSTKVVSGMYRMRPLSFSMLYKIP